MEKYISKDESESSPEGTEKTKQAIFKKYKPDETGNLKKEKRSSDDSQKLYSSPCMLSEFEEEQTD